MRRSFSIVINTLDRVHLLRNTLQSLRYLDHPAFEVIVVNGPSKDGTEHLLKEFKVEIRSFSCPIANLSVSRNIGIENARGEIVAFLDDDAIPDRNWLVELESFYQENVAGVGGWVFDRDGYRYQSQYLYSSRFGYNFQRSDRFDSIPGFPFAENFPYITGCNSSFRCDRIREIGGFDEEYEYFLDETDVCIRLTDAGYQIKCNPKAIVFHKYAASNLRDGSGKFRRFYPIAKNMAYFMYKHAVTEYDRQIACNQIEVYQNRMINYLTKRSLIDRDLNQVELQTQLADISRACAEGLARAKIAQKTGGRRRRLSPANQSIQDTWRRGSSDRLSIALVSADYPPQLNGGIAKWMSEVAEGLSHKGHDIHVITLSRKDNNEVDFQSGYWIHKVRPKSSIVDHRSLPLFLSRNQSPLCDRWSLAARDEINRVSSYKTFDGVLAPIWAAEGFRFLGSETPLITSLHTTMKTVKGESPHWKSRILLRKLHVEPVINAERALLKQSDYILANSNAIIEQIEREYEVPLRNSPRTFLIPHGLKDEVEFWHRNWIPKDRIRILFVGRLERRKGIDTLLEAALPLMEKNSNLELFIVGEHRIAWADGTTSKDFFEKVINASPARARVSLLGFQDSASLSKHYQDADIFVAPSRFESFGLIIVEAMMRSLPILSTRAGGIPEIIKDQETGILVEPDNSLALRDALQVLINNPQLRERLGKSAREAYLKSFSLNTMADRIEGLFYEIRARRNLQHRIGSTR